jgi:hypothetical protein
VQLSSWWRTLEKQCNKVIEASSPRKQSFRGRKTDKLGAKLNVDFLYAQL